MVYTNSDLLAPSDQASPLNGNDENYNEGWALSEKEGEGKEIAFSASLIV